MSVASEASQIRGPGAPSSTRRLGRPITTPTPGQTATDAGDPHQIQALRSSSSHDDDGSQSPTSALVLALTTQALLELLPPQPKMMLLPPYANVSSIRKIANRGNCHLRLRSIAISCCC
jgi:hypothetical protein